ncbi:Protein GrpE [uncultured archaeon]|nr:Protein GrpE [uncultured archaeon]
MSEQGAEKGAEPPEVAELKDRLMRLVAEFDNYKKRVAKDIDASKKLGKAELMKSIVPVLDEFELAINAKGLDPEAAKGVELVYSNLVDSLEREGLRTLESDGKYDPFKHEILLTRESGSADGTILSVIRKGYAIGDILIRPASVIVSRTEKSEKPKIGE